MTGTFEPDELEFLAEDSTVTIIPSVKLPVFYMLAGDVGPMEPLVPVDVPLWLAVHMKQRKQCRLVVPAWLAVEPLLAQKDDELNSDEQKAYVIKQVPSPFYVEISQIILDNFGEEVCKTKKCILLRE